jgi:hypothetical protein
MKILGASLIHEPWNSESLLVTVVTASSLCVKGYLTKSVRKYTLTDCQFKLLKNF